MVLVKLKVCFVGKSTTMVNGIYISLCEITLSVFISAPCSAMARCFIFALINPTSTASITGGSISFLFSFDRQVTSHNNCLWAFEPSLLASAAQAAADVHRPPIGRR